MSSNQADAPLSGEMVGCVACGHGNASTAKFCASCGHGMTEPCIGCGASVTLDQKFCGECGEDLEATLRAKTENYERWLTEGIRLGKAYAFSQSLDLLNRVVEQKDHRFKTVTDQARHALEKITNFRNQTIASSDKAMARAKEAVAENKITEAVQLLRKVPEPLLDAESKKLLAKHAARQDQLSSLVKDLQAAMKETNWSLSGQLLDQLIELDPGEKKYPKLARQISEKLVKSAERRFQNQDFAGALKKLECVTSSCRNDAFNKMHQDLQNVAWMSSQFAIEPFATPPLARLAIRFAKLLPENANAKQVAKETTAAAKRAPKDSRLAFGEYKADRSSWLGGDAGHLLFPSCIDRQDEPLLRSNVAQFNVATGLALSGLGFGRIPKQFETKKGLFGGRRKKSKDTCWGIDLGTTGIRAVKIRRIQESRKSDVNIELESMFIHTFETPLNRSAPERDAEIIQDGLHAMQDKFKLADDPIWVNLCGIELISRFVRLPPVKDKQAVRLLEVEITNRIPFPLEDLEVIRWIANSGDSEKQIHGRPALAVAARKYVIDQRLNLFKNAGINVDAVQPDPLALVNLVTHEFSSVWDQSDDDSAEASIQDDNDSSDEDVARSAIAMLDCGGSTTSLILVSGQACWFWTIEAGGEEFTSIAARATGRVRGEAEMLKREPAKVTFPIDVFDPIQEKMKMHRSRIEKMLGEAEKQIGAFEVKQCWCVGGGSLTHGWLRNMMLDRSGK